MCIFSKKSPIDYDLELLAQLKRRIIRHAFGHNKQNKEIMFSISDKLSEIAKELESISKDELSSA